jgi:uncharacterized cupin superfamily protein
VLHFAEEATKEAAMTANEPPKFLLTAAELAAAPERHLRHPFNPRSDVYLRSLGRPVGLKRLSLSLARVPPGGESFIYHAHEHDEEFVYVLSGRGRAEIGDEILEVGPGDFMGFPTPSVGHHLTNPYGEDLVYLMGGEHSALDIGRFPKIGKRVVFGEDTIYAVDDAGVQPMTGEEWLAEKPAHDGQG